MPAARVELPFPQANGLSKNRTKRVGKRRMYLSDEGRSAREMAEEALTRATAGQAWVTNRVRVTISLVRANARKDVANFVDEVCDAVEKVIGVNDSWYSVSAEWTLGETETLTIEIAQEDGAVESRICGKCHRLLPIEEFGTSGGCRPCVLAYNRAAYARRKGRLSGGRTHDAGRASSSLAGQGASGQDLPASAGSPGGA